MKIVQLTVLISLIPLLLQADKRIATIIMPHSPSVNAARELAGWEHFVNRESEHSTYGAITINPEYTTTFRPERIAQCLYGDAILDYNMTFTVAGSRAANRADAYWLADYFGLPSDFESRVQVYPQIHNWLIDLDAFVGLSDNLPGIYFRAHTPLIHSSWNLKMCETLISTGTLSHDPGYFNASGIDRTQLGSSFTQFIMGNDTVHADDLTFHQLKHAKMNSNTQTETAIGDIQLSLGWNAWQKKKYHLGAKLHTSIPTGTIPNGCWLFEPIVGNGHHWEIGGGISGHLRLWHDEETETECDIYLDVTMTHLFSSRQCRSFDLCSSLNSRYMLAQKMSPEITNNLRGLSDGLQVEPTAQYKREVTTIVNLTTLPVNVSVKMQTDLALVFNYADKRNSWGIGYGYWTRSCEYITICGPTPFDSQLWALKGDASLFGFENNAKQTPIALSATQSNATVHAGKNFPRTGATTATNVETGKENLNIDNPALTFADSNDDGTFLSVQTEPGSPNQIRTSLQPVILTTADIDIESAQTNGSAHKIFSHYTHTLSIRSALPYIGFGGEIEFGPQAHCPGATTTKDPECVNIALSFWGIWIKGGVAF